MKITPRPKNERESISVKTKPDVKESRKPFKWWNANSKEDLANQIISTSTFLKEQQQYRYRAAAIHARLYGNMPIFNVIGSNLSRMTAGTNLPIDRPTMNVIQSCIDTIVARMVQSKPRPVFLTDGSDYKQRNTAKQLNSFIMGEFYRTKAYMHGERRLLDAAIFGTGVTKVIEKDKKVALERKMATELLFDVNDAMYGNPRQLFEFQLCDRGMISEYFPEAKAKISRSQQAYPDASADSERTASDQIMLVEAWHLPSGKDSGDGVHAIVSTEGVIFEEKFTKDKFPFVFLDSSQRVLGMWGQGTAERLMGTQVEINKLLMTISNSINLVGVPRVFVEQGSKVNKASFNNNVGTIVSYSGTKPQYEVAPCVPQELYAQLQRLIDYAYQQEGVSMLSASSIKPAGLNSGEAIRNYDDLQSDRFAYLNKRYDSSFIDCTYLMIDKAKDICEREGKYTTVYPNKDGTKEVDLPSIDLLDDPVIQCYDSSSLPRDPAGRLQKVTEMMQSGMISLAEGRRLLDYPDIDQIDKLANAAEERILKSLDAIVENGKYSPPDSFTDLVKAEELVTQYLNLYLACKLEESKAEKLRTYSKQVQVLKQSAASAAQAQIAQSQAVSVPQGAQPMAVPQGRPESSMLPIAPQGA